MNYQIKINDAATVEQMPGYWTNEDYKQLLGKFNYPDADKASNDTLNELLLMAITDYEPNEAAAILLAYKLGEELNEGQIDQISNDMLLDKIVEEYPDISLHARLFHINQLLYKAFNGKFPNTKATLIDCTITPLDEDAATELTREMALKLLGAGLSDSNLVKRLFTEQMAGDKSFPEAESILWELKPAANHLYSILTSENWISTDDFTSHEFEGAVENTELLEQD
ncbi:hypothetical protein [uncultured Pontibacter sp.]|uniref:hypothetical protein n=1 Tax=uncultured Pontibacter sp. TaxID=453356 RepID=UPI00263393BD|nr:hypothetical protein [uncultured Pontibacter sp.]